MDRATVIKTYATTAQRKADNRFYASTPWRKLRLSFLKSHPLCVRCDRLGITKEAEHVDHILDRKDRPDLALEWSNLQGLCPPCHNSKRAEKNQSGISGKPGGE